MLRVLPTVSGAARMKQRGLPKIYHSTRGEIDERPPGEGEAFLALCRARGALHIAEQRYQAAKDRNALRRKRRALASQNERTP